jgi:hypothetical protein
VRYDKETRTAEELIYYWNEEQWKWLYMNPSGVHYRKKRRHVHYADDDDDYEIVHLDKTCLW